MIIAGKGTASERYVLCYTTDLLPFFFYCHLWSTYVIKCIFYSSLNCGIGGGVYKNDLSSVVANESSRTVH